MSTFVNDLRLEEIGSGERSGTWGTATNTNLSLIAEAFSYGTETMGDANTTITMSDAVSDEVRSLYLKITSSADLTTTRVVTLAPNAVSKVWIIENATSGSQIITIKQGSGATVNIPNGSVKVIATDGGGTSGAVFDLFTDLDVAGTFAVAGNTTVGGTLTSTGAVTANAGVSIDNITIDGTEIDLSSGDLTLDVAGDIVLNSDDGIIFLKDDTATFGSLNNSSGNLIIKSGTTTAATFSGANVTLAGTVVTGGLTTLGGNLIIPNAGNIGSVGDTDAIAISSTGVVTMNQIPVFSAGINVSGGTIAGTIATAAQTNITSVGALGGGSITSGFGNIDNGSSSITTTGTISFGSLTDGTTTITSVDQDISSVSSSHDTLATALAIKTYVDNQTVSATGIVGTGTGNTAIGTNAMDSVQSGGNQNTAFGFNAGTGITTGDRNVHIGFEAGKLVTEGGRNVYIGAFAGDAATGSTEGNNTCVGDSAGSSITDGSENTCLGQGAGASLTTATGHTALGRGALENGVTTIGNTGVGYHAGNHVTGFYLTAVGYNAAAGVSGSSTSSFNTAVGYKAGESMTNAVGNTHVGTHAGAAVTGGNHNSTFGYNAGVQITSGFSNTLIGYNSGSSVATGDRNTLIGESAASSLTGDNNTALGYGAGNNKTSGNYNINIGYLSNASSATVSGEITLGDSNISALRCNVQSISSLSDSRDKTDIVDSNFGLDFVNNLRPVQFKWKRRNILKEDFKAPNNGKTRIGFIAQDFQKVMSNNENDILDLVYESNPERLEAKYGNLIPILTKAIQDLSKQNEELENRIKTLENK
tara:strand:+ start:62 stop:2509 length:2448 start_codon:yes stop_codon:yes gene_type:complete